MGVNSDARLLQQVPLFSEVDPAHLKVLTFSSKRRTIAAGSYIFKKGKTGAAAYLILSGRAIIRPDNKVSTPAIARASAGALLGETSMIGRLPYSISAQAVDEVTTLKLTNDMFKRVCAEFPDVGVKVLAVLGRKLNVSLQGFSDVQSYFDEAKSFTKL
jgi:CRP-like cAMP-binding protein